MPTTITLPAYPDRKTLGILNDAMTHALDISRQINLNERMYDDDPKQRDKANDRLKEQYRYWLGQIVELSKS